MLIMSAGPIKASARAAGIFPVKRFEGGGRLGIRRVALWTVAGLVLAGAGFALLAYEREMAPVARPDPASFDKALVERGRVLANYGDCTACHTRPDGAPVAGDLAFE